MISDAAKADLGVASLPALSHPERCEDSTIVDATGLGAVFDGIGGAAGGQEASLAAVLALAGRLEQLRVLEDAAARTGWLQDSLLAAGQNVREIRKSFSQGTTAAVALLAEGCVLAASIGDSRVYRYDHSQKQLTLLTVDDDILDHSPEAGRARSEVDEAISIQEVRSVLARRLFVARNRLADEVGMRTEPVAVGEHLVAADDLIVVSSDGLHDNLTRAEIEKQIQNTYSQSNPQQVAEALCRSARQRSTEAHFRAKDDDISVVILQVH